MKGYQIRQHSELNKNQYSNYVLGGDIGGTNTSVAVFGVKYKTPTIILSLHFKSKELNSLIPAIAETLNYVKDKHNIEIETACLAGAGPVSFNNDFCKPTYLNWNIDAKEILEKTSLKFVSIINDFEAIGYGINMIDIYNNNDVIKIKEGDNSSDRFTKAVIGGGTGLGEVILFYNESSKSYIPIASEGGHSDFPSQTAFENKLVEFIKKSKNIKEEITYDQLLSGKGIESIYLFLMDSGKFKHTEYTKEIMKIEDKAEIISKYKNKDEACRKTFKIYSKFYGRCAKNLVLTSLARSGLYIAGGIAVKNKDIFGKDFINEFMNSNKLSEILEKTSIYLITNYDVGMLGAGFAAATSSVKENTTKFKIGFIGLGKMGRNMVLKLLKEGHEVVAYDRNTVKTKKMEKEKAIGAYSVKELIENLPARKIIWLMVAAGKSIDGIISTILPFLKKGDIIIDGGNSYFKDSIKRHNELKGIGINFLDCGTSGGISGARHGACMMIGGDKHIFKEIKALFKSMCVKEGYGYVGGAGAGHFIKMVHNGIEYGMMGSIGEGLEAIEKNKEKFKLDIQEVSKVYAHGSIIQGKLVNWLLEAVNDKQDFKSISGTVPHGETEKEMEKLSNTSDMPILKEAIEMRKKSRENSRYAGKVISALRERFGGHKVKRK